MSSSSSFSRAIPFVIETMISLVKTWEEMYGDDNAESSRPTTQKYLRRDREAGHERLIHDYFGKDVVFQGYYFPRRFRMFKPLFICIVENLMRECQYFQQRSNPRGKT